MATNLTKEQRVEISRRAWQLRVQGWSQPRIADEFGVDQSTVSRLLAATEKRLAREFESQAMQVKARQTAQLEHVYAEAMEQWTRSCADAEHTRTVRKRIEPAEAKDGDAPRAEVLVETIREVRGQSGNPALLAQARGALDDIRKIWGLDAPQKTDVTSAGSPFKVYLGFDPDAHDETDAEDECPPS